MMAPDAAAYAATAHFRLDRQASSRTIVLLHGLGGDHRQLWRYCDGVTGRVRATRLAPDARGHGETAMTDLGVLDFSTLARDVLALVDTLDVPNRLVVVGVSMGAATALRLALDAPDRLDALVLIRPAWLNAPSPPNLEAFPQIAALLRSDGPSEGRARFARSATFHEIDLASPSAAASLLEQFDKPRAQDRVRRLEELPRAIPYEMASALELIDVPTALIAAPSDPIHPLAFAEELASRIRDARLDVVVARDRDERGYHDQLRHYTGAFLAAL